MTGEVDDSSLKRVAPSWHKRGSSFDGLEMTDDGKKLNRFETMKDHPVFRRHVGSKAGRRALEISDELFGVDHESRLRELGAL